MEKIIVSASRSGDTQEHDLELFAELAGGLLEKEIAECLGWDSGGISYEIEFQKGRFLHPTESLAQVGAWDGTHLIFHPSFINSDNVQAQDNQLSNRIYGINP